MVVFLNASRRGRVPRSNASASQCPGAAHCVASLPSTHNAQRSTFPVTAARGVWWVLNTVVGSQYTAALSGNVWRIGLWTCNRVSCPPKETIHQSAKWACGYIWGCVASVPTSPGHALCMHVLCISLSHTYIFQQQQLRLHGNGDTHSPHPTCMHCAHI